MTELMGYINDFDFTLVSANELSSKYDAFLNHVVIYHDFYFAHVLTP